MQQPFQAIKISDHVYWVGAIDPAVRDFHGYKTARGTSYNAYLIMGEAPVLVDTVKAPFYDEMMSRIKSVIDPKKIRYIISNHAEMDHSGCLVRAINTIQPDKIFASKMGVKALRAHFHLTDEITELEHTQCLDLGNFQFTFVETRMLHWPDSMMTYFVNDGVLFSQDGFGMHLATHKLCAHDNSYAVMEYEAKKYFANILLPYSNFATRLLGKFHTFKLDVKILAPDHGPVWCSQKDIGWIMGLWKTWAEQAPNKKAVVVYDTMWNSTAKMAAAIADGVTEGHAEVKLMPLGASHRSDVATELLEAGALLMGSPTINGQLFPTVADILSYLRGLKPQNLIGQAFGSYGWSGDSIRLIQQGLEHMNVSFIEEPIKVQYVPDAKVLNQCRLFGLEVADALVKQSG